jgi:hypothetical protein
LESRPKAVVEVPLRAEEPWDALTVSAREFYSVSAPNGDYRFPHSALLSRLAGYRNHLTAVHQSGAGMSSASKGNERRAFVHDFLEATFLPPNRFGTGDCIDRAGNKSGELDVVLEYPFLPSLTLQGHSRLYLAEGIAVAIEVKSNISSQWNEAVDTGKRLKVLRREFGSVMSMGPVPLDVPFFVVRFTGWKSVETIISHCSNSPIDGALIVDAGLCYIKMDTLEARSSGDLALWTFISTLAYVMSGLKATSANPFDYAN